MERKNVNSLPNERQPRMRDQNQTYRPKHLKSKSHSSGGMPKICLRPHYISALQNSNSLLSSSRSWMQ